MARLTAHGSHEMRVEGVQIADGCEVRLLEFACPVGDFYIAEEFSLMPHSTQPCHTILRTEEADYVFGDDHFKFE